MINNKIKKLLLVENICRDLEKSRFPLGEYLLKNGYLVSYACSDCKSALVYKVRMTRSSLNPIVLFQGLFDLLRAEHRSDVDIVLSFRLMPNILNFLASFFSRKKRILVITGLGISFLEQASGLKVMVSRSIIKGFYQFAATRHAIIAQNPDDLAELGISGTVILGSGVRKQNVEFNFDESPLKLLFVGRLLKSKGIEDAFEIFCQIKARKEDVSFVIAGDLDSDNPDSISRLKLNQMIEESGVEYLGHVDDLTKVYNSANVLLFPSKYREGVPRVIIEALQFGLTIITYDMPGCKETVKRNGILLQGPKDEKLISYLLSLNKERFFENKVNSQKIFDEKFCDEVVYPHYLNVIAL